MRTWLLVLLLSLLVAGCTQQSVVRTVGTTPASIDARSDYLKLHLLDGTLYVLDKWMLDSTTVTGHGVYLSLNRDTLAKQTFTIPRDHVVLYETNRLTSSVAGVGLGIVTLGHAALAIFCSMNPKACFGSCPTFYVGDGASEHLVAEGFSASVLPSLEASDIDQLYDVRPRGGKLDVTMKNEALETHVVRSVELLAIPRSRNERIYRTEDDRFFTATNVSAPLTARAEEGDVRAALDSFDGIERRSWTDSNDLARRETIDLTFESDGAGDYGIVVAARQTFVSTYLFYTGLGYFGRNVGDWFANFERHPGSAGRTLEGFRTKLGGIEVLAEDSSGAWIPCGEAYEMGPIASDLHLIRLPGIRRPRRIRLRMSKGSWRIDWVALAKLGEERQPITLHPTVRHVAEQSLLSNDGSYPQVSSAIVTLPGDEYRYSFKLPDTSQIYELFLRSQGYYLEWMREDWLQDEDPAKAAAMFLDPRGALRREAAAFKAIEPVLEADFWKSKYSRTVE